MFCRLRMGRKNARDAYASKIMTIYAGQGLTQWFLDFHHGKYVFSHLS